MEWDEVEALFFDGVRGVLQQEAARRVPQLVAALDSGATRVRDLTAAYVAAPEWIRDAR
jgi:hypothetical protein